MQLQSLRYPLCALGLVATAGAQVVVPASAQTANPYKTLTAYNNQTFFSTSSATTLRDSHTQTLYDVNEVALPAAVWTSMAVRRVVGVGNSNPAFSATVTIQMAMSSTPYSAPSTTFAANLGSAPFTVFNGTLSLPAAANPGTWPAPWQAPIPFATPFVFAKASGSTFVVDILQIGNTSTSSWFLEASVPDNGFRGENPINGASGYQGNCKFSNGNANGAIGYFTPYVGNIWNINYQNLPPNLTPGWGAVGASGAGGSWGGFALPIDLTPFNAPNCKWGVSMDVVYSLSANASGIAQGPTINIPNDPSLINGEFYDQSIWIDPPANAWGVVTSWTSKWRIGTGKGVPAAFLAVTGNTAATAATGTHYKETAPTLLFN